MHTTAKKIIVLVMILFSLSAQCLASTGHLSEINKTNLSLPFLANDSDDDILFYAKTFAGMVWVHRNGDMAFQSLSSGQHFVEHLHDALPFCPIAGDVAQSSINRFDPRTMKTGNTRVSAFHHILMPDIYPDITLKLKAYSRTVEKIFIVNPGANPDHIRIQVKGAQNLEISQKGELNVLPQGIRYSVPIAYQIIDNQKVPIDVCYRVEDNQVYGFELAQYNPNYPLIIDPFIAGTFFGGDDRDEIQDVAVDANGDIYVVGTTWSSNIPVSLASSGYNQIYNPAIHMQDIFVAKFNSDLTTLHSATFIGGSKADVATNILIDSNDSVFICGQTTSSDFPIKASTNKYKGNGDIIAFRMNKDLSTLQSSTYFGGDQMDMPEDMLLYNNQIFITGYTQSKDFDKNGNVSTFKGVTDAFVSRLTYNLDQLESSYFIGGSNDDRAFTMHLGTNDYIIIAGKTYSSDFEFSNNNYDNTINGGADAFIYILKADFKADTNTVLASTFLGGNRGDEITAIEVDESGEKIYATGTTSSSNFPIVDLENAYAKTPNGTDVFVVQFDKVLTTLAAGTFLGGMQGEKAVDIQFNNNQEIMIAGTTSSIDFPTTLGTFDETYNSGLDIFIATFNSTLTTLSDSSFLGESQDDFVSSIAIQEDNIVIAGSTWSNHFPISSTAVDRTFNEGEREGFIFILSQDLEGMLRFSGVGNSIDITMSEDASPNAFSLNLLATHDDPSKTIKWQISSNPSNGDVYTPGDANPQAISYMPYTDWYGTDQFDVKIYDDYDHSDQITVYVHVLPEPDPPKFTSPGDTYSVTENSPRGITLGTIEATDPDEGDLTFTIISGNHSNAFGITSSNVLYVENSTSVNYEDYSQFHLEIAAENASYSTVESFMIQLINQNDPPSITANQSFSVTENAAVGTNIGTVEASDEDGDSLSYYIIDGNTSDTFSIDLTSGELFVNNNTSLSFGADALAFRLTIEISDGTSADSLTSTSIITVTINDINDPPIIKQNQIYTTIENNENFECSVESSDADEDTLSYAITGGNSDGAFIINEQSGLITLQNLPALDYERYQTFSIAVSVHDGTYTTTDIIEIKLTDENDNPPVIESQTFHIDENVGSNTEVGIVIAQDPDELAVLNYSIIEDSPFDIAANSGLLTVKPNVDLNCETRCAYTLTVEVSDSAYTDAATVFVKLNDINESPPKFSKDIYEFVIKESSPQDESLIGNNEISAIDDDFTQTLKYSIQSGNTGNAFQIDENTGKITVYSSASLDHEKLTHYTLSIKVSDGALFDTAEVAIRLIDVNEHAPIIEPLEITIKEDIKNGADIGQVQAHDPDADDTLDYSIIDDIFNVFNMDQKTGKISIRDTNRIDYDSGKHEFFLKVAVSDGMHTTVEIVVIRVQNVNDEIPIIIEQNYMVKEGEKDNTWIGTIVAYDIDPLDTIQYTLISGNIDDAFKLDSSTGKLSVNNGKKINYENIPLYELTIIVTDEASNKETATIMVKVNNINDVPQINSRTYADIPEDIANDKVIGNLNVADDDSETWTYDIRSGNIDNAFAINNDGNIIVKNADAISYEKQNLYLLRVTVSDDLSTSEPADITIHISDRNDATVFEDQIFYVDENSDNNTDVGTLMYSDEDPSSILGLKILAGNDNNAFVLDSDVIRVDNPEFLDFEVRQDFVLIVQVFDTVEVCGTKLRENANITIRLNNLNDNQPEANNLTLTINENLPNDEVIGQLTATDADYDQLTYDIISGDDKNVFAFSGDNSGDIIVQNSSLLDYESQTEFNLVASVSDGLHSITATVFITVNNLNDNRPEIQSTSLSIAEDAPLGVKILQILADDKDNDTLSYSIDPSNPFAIDSVTGEVFVQSALDYEKVPAYTLTVQVDDGKFQESAQISIHITNVNDNPPLVYDQTFAIKNDVENGSEVGLVVMHDIDNDPITFVFVDSSSIFDIDSQTGLITVIDSAQIANDVTATYQLKLRVFDGKYLVEVQITIDVLDSSDSQMVIDQTFSVQENSPNDTLLGKIVAPDAQEFKIYSGNIYDTFKLDSKTGELRVNKSSELDYENRSEYELKIMTTINDIVYNSKVFIKVKDVNEFAPTFDEPAYYFDVPENSQIFTLVGVFTATDQDTTDTLSYTITDGIPYNPFILDTQSGQLKLSKDYQLDYEAVSAYTLTVIVSDGKNAVQTLAVVRIIDKNEYPPEFVSDTYSFTIAENIATGSNIGNILATDKDPESLMIYDITAGNDHKIFKINNKGDLLIDDADGLDFEIHNAYTMTVQISDGLYKDTAKILVAVQDVNDPPEILLGLYPRIPDIRGGSLHSLALNADGQMFSFGENKQGQLGNETLIDELLPVPVYGNHDFVKMDTRYFHSIAIQDDGTVWTWGWNAKGQLGDGGTADLEVPTQVKGLVGVKDVAAGAHHSMALMPDGSIRSWGANTSGQLGDGNMQDRLQPVHVQNLSNVQAIFAGHYHSMAILADRTVMTWGKNDAGQLGDHTQLDRSVPIRILELVNVVSLAGGKSHSLALKMNGTVWAWGLNSRGQLGTGGTDNESHPIQLSLSNIVAIAAGGEHSMALQDDGTIWTWGLNEQGQLGNGTTDNQHIPQKIESDEFFVAIAAGERHSMALSVDGTVWAWGQNTKGQLGNNTIFDAISPQTVHTTNDTPLNIGIEAPPTLTIKEDNQTEYFDFVVRDPETPADQLIVSAYPQNEILVPTDQIDITCTNGQCQAMMTPSKNGYGETLIYFQVSDNEKTSVSTVRLIVTEENDPPTISEIPAQRTSENTSHVIYFKVNDLDSPADSLTLEYDSNNPSIVKNIAFGGSGKDRFATITPENKQWGIAIITFTVSDQSLSTPTSFTLTVNAAPHITDIGDITIDEDTSTSFEFEISDSESDPMTVVGFSENEALLPNENIIINCLNDVCKVQINPIKDASGESKITFQVSDGYAFSEDTFLFTVASGNDPPLITIDLATGTPELSAGAYHSMAVRNGNEVMTWGRNDMGQLGNGELDQSKSTPTILSDLESIVKLAGGEKHSLALSDDGGVWSWGNNSHGQLGIGDISATHSPKKVQIISDIIALDAGSTHSLALHRNGMVWAWGNNNYGQLGIVSSGDKTSENKPVLITDLDSCVAIAAGYAHSVALKNDGTIWTWGLNTSGQLGDNSESNTSVPSIVPGLNNVIAIAAGDYHTVALKNDGSVWTWGDNPSGQLGDGTTQNNLTPVRVLNITNVTAIAAGYVHTLALRNDGTVWAWGDNEYGQLGINSTAKMVVQPKQADMSPQAIAIDAGHFHSLILKSDGSVWSFGDNIYGQLGNNTDPYSPKPLEVDDPNQTDKLNISIPLMIDEDTQTEAINFYITDKETPAEELLISVVSSNPRLVPEDAVTLEGVGKYQSLTIRPTQNGYGLATITIKVSDGDSFSTDSFNLLVNEVNDSPQISDIGYQSIYEDTPTLNIPFTISDIEMPADYLLVSATSAYSELIPNANIQISGNGTYRTVVLTPAENMHGIATITIEVSDGVATTSETFSVRVKDVNDAPEISSIPDQTTDEDTKTQQIAFSISDIETSAENLVVSAVTSDESKVQPENIIFEGSGEDRSIVIHPQPDQYGFVEISIQVSDGLLQSSTSFQLYIEPMDDVPNISKISNQEIYQYVASTSIPFKISDTETPAENLTLNGTSSETSIVKNDNISFSGTGENREVIIVTEERQFGTTEITIAVSDGKNTQRGTFSLTVNPQHDWDTIETNFTEIDFEDIWGRSANDIFAVGNGGAIFHYNGISWSREPIAIDYTGDFNAIWGDSGEVYVVGNEGMIVRFNGKSWTRMYSNTSKDLYGVWGNGRSVFAVGKSGVIVKFNGVSWEEESSGTTTTLLDIWGNQNKMYAVGNSGMVLEYDGFEWRHMTTETPYTLRGVWGSSETDVFAVGDRVIIHYDGTKWVEQARINDINKFQGVWGLSSSIVFAAGIHGTILFYDGEKWIETQNDTQHPLTSIWGASVAEIFVVGDAGTILKRTTGQLSGQITTHISGSNAIVVGAQVTIVETGQQAVTDEKGQYVFNDVPIGIYTIEVSSTHFKDHTISGVRIPGGEVIIPDIDLTDLQTGMYTQSDLDTAVYNERIKYDPDGDGVISLENIIYFLQLMGGI